MKKLYIAADIFFITLCGLVISNSYAASGEAAWSFVISSVNSSPFETVKPYALVYIMWTFIELSYKRPHLIHFVSARIISLFVFVFMSLFVLWIFKENLSDGRISTALIFVFVVCAEILQYFIYKSRVRFELFFAVLMIGFAVLFFSLVFCSFYPPHCGMFYDAAEGFYGIKMQ